MGLNNSTIDKVTIDQKLQFLQKKVIKPCTYHRKQCIMYCSIPNCQKCPYLCQDCMRENIHQHQQGIYNHNQFIKAIVTLIQVKRSQQNQVLEASVTSPAQDYNQLYKQQLKLLQQVNALQAQITNIISQYRNKLQSSIERLSKKALQSYDVKSSSYINFYHNPNILACKLSSQQNDKFLLQLKSQLRGVKKKGPAFNEEENLFQLKNQLGNMKGKIRDLLNVTNIANLVKKNSLSSLIFNPTLKKTFVLSSDCPLKMYQSGSNVNISTVKQVYNIQVLTKQVRKLAQQPLFTMSSKKTSEQFLGLLTPLKLFVYDCKTINQLSLMTKVSCVNILKTKRRLYGLLGQQQGIFNVINLQQNKSIFYHRCGDQPITFIQICQANSTICCAGKKTPIFIFRYKPKIINFQDSETQFQLLSQTSLSILPQNQLQLMKINNNQLYLFGPSRNIVIFDMMLNTQLIRTQYIKKCNNFIQAQFVTYNDNDYMISLNQGEDVVNVWQFDKIKRNLKVDQILKQKNQRPIISIVCVRNQIWIARQNQKNVDVYSLISQ